VFRDFRSGRQIRKNRAKKEHIADFAIRIPRFFVKIVSFGDIQVVSRIIKYLI
jgi:hypothetical protein